MTKKKEDLGGVWRTVGGRRIFIKDGQDLYEAMNDSGKFTNLKRTNKTRQGVKEIDYIGQDGKKHKMDSYEYPEDRDGYHKYLTEKYGTYKEEEIKDKYGRTDYKKLRKEFYESQKEKHEYELYKRARQDENSIDPMTENSTDWEELDRKYKDRYEKEQSSTKENKKNDDFVKNNPDWEFERVKKDFIEKTDKREAEVVAEDYKKIYQKAQAEYEKYRDENSNKYSNWNSPEYKEMSAKREQLRVKAEEAKVNALKQFNKTIPYNEMFDVAKQLSGSKNIEFGEPEVVVKNGEVYTKYKSNDIKGDAGIFSSVLKNVNLEEFNSQLYIDKNGEFTYWGSMDLRYEHNSGGTNGMKLLDYKYNTKTGWDITDSAGYKYENGIRLDNVSDLANYYMKHYGETRADAVAMAEKRLEDLKRREKELGGFVVDNPKTSYTNNAGRIVKDSKYYDWVDEVDPNSELTESELEQMYRSIYPNRIKK